MKMRVNGTLGAAAGSDRIVRLEGCQQGDESTGFRGIRLGPRVLRTETAGVAALAALQALAGDLA